MSNYRLLYAGYGALNRTKNSGYEHITEFNNPDYEVTYLDATKLPFGFIDVGHRGKRINLYFLEMAMHRQMKKYDIIHNFVCDNQLLFKIPPKRNFVAVATTHLNYKDFSNHQLSVLRTYDAVIVLNSKEKEELSNQGINSIYIPHGFDTPRFSIDDGCRLDKNKINICFCGVCYRDYETLFKFIDYIRDRDDIVLHILGQRKETKNKLNNLKQKNIIVHDFLSDESYYTLVQNCDYSFLPLTFATANNTLLEAEFLGIRSILPMMDGITDYALNDGQNNLFYTDDNSLKEIIENLKKQDVSEQLLIYSSQFKWDKVYTQLDELYKELIMAKRGENK